MKSVPRIMCTFAFLATLAICISGLGSLHAEPAGTKPQTAATELILPLSQRFANSERSEVPDFQKHVMPLLGRLGCNGRACHGSFQGQGGFQLSLFGYDFQADHAALLAEDAARVDPDDVDESF